MAKPPAAPEPDDVTEEVVKRLPEILSREIVLLPPDAVQQHPKNPNEGDLDALIESIEENDFYDPILVQQSTNYALSGNHRITAAIRLGMPELPFIFIDVDDERAESILLSSNQVGRRGHDNDTVLAELLAKRGDNLRGTGFDRSMVDDLLRRSGTLARERGSFLDQFTKKDDDGKGDDPPPPDGAPPEVQLTLSMSAADRSRVLGTLDVVKHQHNLATRAEALVMVCDAHDKPTDGS